MTHDENGKPDVTRSRPWPPLLPEQAAKLKDLKLKFNALIMDCYGDTNYSNEENRLWALARTELELAAMWAVKAVTSDRGQG